LDRSRHWAIRLVHENRFHERSSFITLTYSQEHLPWDGSLDVTEWQRFMKRLRRALGSTKLRFFHAGEYGEKLGRPHYHAIIFGEDFYSDRYNVEVSDRGDETWASPLLDRIWGKGLCRIGAVTFESCAYVARYVTKKVTGWNALEHYERVSPMTAEVYHLHPEYATMSRRPGIGALHFEKFHKEIYPHDKVVSRGVLVNPPKFYDKLLEKFYPSMYASVKEERECALQLSSSTDRTPDRLEVRETVKMAQVGHLSRRYEIG
jgi:hypothetical protein